MQTLLETVRQDWQRRPVWMNLIFYFCLYMTFLYMPFDLFFKPVAEDEEIWFGFTLTGWWAKATEPLHWLIYGAGAYGFAKMRSLDVALGWGLCSSGCHCHVCLES